MSSQKASSEIRITPLRPYKYKNVKNVQNNVKCRNVISFDHNVIDRNTKSFLSFCPRGGAFVKEICPVPGLFKEKVGDARESMGERNRWNWRLHD